MDVFFLIAVFLFGLTVGSFLNCLIYRLAPQQRGGAWLLGRSFCPRCKQTLNWKDLIPIFSFLWLQGRCRYCREKISIQYPLVELATGVLFVLCYLFYLPWIFYVIIPFLIVIFVYDLQHYLIPDSVIYPALVIASLYQLLGIWNLGNWDLLGIWNLGLGIFPAGFLLAVILFSRGQWMGMGDFKLAILMGFILGWPSILAALFLAFFIGAIMGIGLILLGKKTLKSEVPFGPFLVSGTLIALFLDQEIINWYLNFYA